MADYARVFLLAIDNAVVVILGLDGAHKLEVVYITSHVLVVVWTGHYIQHHVFRYTLEFDFTSGEKNSSQIVNGIYKERWISISSSNFDYCIFLLGYPTTSTNQGQFETFNKIN